MFSNVFEHFFLAYFTQTPQPNLPTPLFRPKTHILLQNNPQKLQFLSNSEQIQFVIVLICAKKYPVISRLLFHSSIGWIFRLIRLWRINLFCYSLVFDIRV